MAGNATARVGSINVLLSTDLAGGVRGLNTFASAVESTGVRTQRSVSGIDRSVGSMNKTLAAINARAFTGLSIQALRARNSIDQLRGIALATSTLLSGLVPTALGASIVRVADRAQLLANNLRTVTKDSADLTRTQNALFDVAQRSRAGFESTVTLYARTARATERLGLSQEKLLRITETVQKAFATGGATPQEAQGAAIQLSQGIASDRFSGDEFRSVAENAPVLLRGIAESLGVSIGRLREMAHEGQLTAKVVTQAILDASKKIDQEFGKTTSTIGQAMTMLDNQLLKFVSDSKDVSAAANAIVKVLNLLGDNVETVAGLLLLLGVRWGAAFGGRQMSNVLSAATSMRALRIEALAAAQSNLVLATAQQTAARQTLASTRAAYEMAKANTVTASTRARLGRELQAAAQAELIATRTATNATIAHGAAMQAASLKGLAYAAAGRAASAAWAFVGGPFGAAILALSAGMYIYQRNAEKAAEITDRYGEAIQRAKEKSDQGAIGVRQTAEAMAAAATKIGDAERNLRIDQAANDFETNIGRMRSAAALLQRQSYEMLNPALGRSVVDLVAKFERGEISAEDLREELDRLANVNPEMSAALNAIQKLGDEADAARGHVEGLTQSLDDLATSWVRAMERIAGFETVPGEKKGRLQRIPSGDEFDRRFGGKYPKDWKEIFPDLFKEEKGKRKDADSRFANSIQQVRDRITALKQEESALGATTREQERRKMVLNLEQEALEDAREEARRKGDQDWQNAKLSKEQIATINEVADAYAAQAESFRRARLAQDLLFERQQLMRTELERTVAAQLKSAGLTVDLSSADAALIRQTEILKKNKEAWESIGEAGQTALDDLFSSAMNGFEDVEDVLSKTATSIAKMISEMGFINPLKNEMYGTNLPTMENVGGLGGFFSALLGGKMPGLDDVGAMDVTAGVVNINGAGPLGGLLSSLTGANFKANTTLEKVLGLTTSNSSDIIRLPNGGMPMALSGIGSPTAGGGYGGDLASNIKQLASNIGADPLDLATLMSFESGFRPQIMGGAGGKYRGLIQMGPWEQQNYGLNSKTSLGDQFGMIERFFKDRGFKPGMSGLDLYSTVNAGSPGRYNASDAANGGTWGSVRDKWLYQMDDHRMKAAELLNSRSTAASKALEQMTAQSSAAGQGLGTLGKGFDAFGNALSKFPSAPSSSGGGGGLLSSLFGGIFGGGFTPFEMSYVSSNIGLFAEGGVTRKPAIFGEGDMAEAAVPLPDGRSIPVKFTKDSETGAPRNETHIHNYAGVSVRSEDSDDGSRTDIFIEKQVANALKRPGSAAHAALETMGVRRLGKVR